MARAMTFSFRMLSALALAGLFVLPAACGDDDDGSTGSTGSGGASSTSSGSQMCTFDAEGGFGPFGEICEDQAGDDPCVTCARANCCAEVTACEGTECACLFECFLSPTCPATECILVCPVDNPEADAVIDCAINSCSDSCVPD